MATVREQVIAIREQDSQVRQVDMAREIGCSRERVRQVLDSLGMVSIPQKPPSICKHCQNEISAEVNRKFCNAECRKAYSIRHLRCSECGVEYIVSKTVFNASIRRGYKLNFCGRACLGKHAGKKYGWGRNSASKPQGAGREMMQHPKSLEIVVSGRMDMDERLKSLLLEQRAKLEQELEEANQEMRDAERRKEQAQIQLRHIKGLLIDNSDEVSGDSAVASANESLPSPEKSPQQLPDICVLAEEVLLERNGVPMHYRDLAQEVQARGAAINGKDPGNTLIAKLTNDRRFVRPYQKGYYALRKDYPHAANVGSRKKAD